jgi:hypothetical protein
MIVRAAGHAIHLITQPDHAALSRRIMEHWVPLTDHPRRASILLAIGEHDNGWREPDDSLMLDETGCVVDFVRIPVAVRQAVWPRGVARLDADAWAAALVAQHAITVYARYRSDAEWSTFFPRMEATRDHLVGAAGVSSATLLDDYTFVRLGDLLSLTFCTGWTDPQHHDGWTVVHHNNRVVVTPDGFAKGEIEIDVRALEVPSTPFASEEALRAALATSPHVKVTGVISRT